MTTASEWTRNSTGEHAILGAVARAFSRASLVYVNHQSIRSLAADLAATRKAHWLEQMPEVVRHFFALAETAQKVRLLTVFHAAGFCYWADVNTRRFTRSYQGTTYNGAAALLVALVEAPQFLDARCLSRLDSESWTELLGGEGALLLIEQRVKFLRALGLSLLEKPHLIEELSRNRTPLQTAFALSRLPGFGDVCYSHQLRLPFLKRAQLLAADLVSLTGDVETQDMGELTAAADYKLPQILRHYGVLQYAQPLAEAVDSQCELIAGSEAEVEIRLGTVMAVELLKEHWPHGLPVPRAHQIDSLLWSRSQHTAMKPYHRCRTVYY